MKRLPLIALPEGYFFWDETKQTSVGVTWPDVWPNTYVTKNSLGDASWPVEVFQVDDDVGCPFRVYWLYPFSPRVHVWKLDRTGQRKSGDDLSQDDTEIYFRQRLGENSLYITRLFLFLAETEKLWNEPDLITRIAILACGSGDEEALYSVCLHSSYFRPSIVEISMSFLHSILRLTYSIGTPSSGTSRWRIRLEALGAALSQNRPLEQARLREILDAKVDFDDVIATARKHGAVANTNIARNLILQRCSLDEMAGICAPIGAPELVFSAEFSPDGRCPITISHAVTYDPLRRDRLRASIAFVYKVLTQHMGDDEYVSACVAAGIVPHQRRRFLFQCWDEPSEANRPSVSFERSVGNSLITLVPDVYFFESDGYRDFAAGLPDIALPWSERRASFIWRGATTGQTVTAENFHTLPRYRLCRIGRSLGPVFDAAITNIVQTDSEETHRLIEAKLLEEGLLAPYMPQSQMGEYRYVLDIDGNANSWGFLQNCF